MQRPVLHALLPRIANPFVRLTAELMAVLPLRCQDITGLRWTHVSFDRRSVHFQLVEGKTKTRVAHRERRTVAHGKLSPWLLAELRRRKTSRPPEEAVSRASAVDVTLCDARISLVSLVTLRTLQKQMCWSCLLLVPAGRASIPGFSQHPLGWIFLRSRASISMPLAPHLQELLDHYEELVPEADRQAGVAMSDEDARRLVLAMGSALLLAHRDIEELRVSAAAVPEVTEATLDVAHDATVLTCRVPCEDASTQC